MMRLIEIITFIAAFVIVTAAIIYLNSIYVNIFQLDFTPRSSVVAEVDSLDNQSAEEETVTDISQESEIDNKEEVELIPEKKEEQIVSTIPEQKKAEIKPVVENKPVQIPVIEETSVSLAQNNLFEVPPQTNNPVDSTYIKWVKSTAGLFESMEAKKAALIIKNYREDVARDIIYKMKRKKAAEVLAELDPYEAKRITQYW